MTTFYLIRHGSNDYFTHTLVGRMPGVHLNETGRREAEELSEGLSREPIRHIFCSPLERCRETAEPLAQARQLPLQISDALAEVEFGEWTGRPFAELDSLERWKQWNAFRAGTRPPGGELMLEVQARVVSLAQKLQAAYPDQGIALVSHGDPLRSLLLHFLGIPLDFIRRIEISPASVTVLRVDNWNIQLQCLNLRRGRSSLPV